MQSRFRTALWIIGLIVAPSLVSAAQMSADDIMQRNYYATKIDAFKGDVTMTLINDNGGSRTRKMSMQSKMKEGSDESKVLMRFKEPDDIKGTGFLQIENVKSDDDIWIYLPALGKTRRLVSGNKKDSFFGSDFSYGDVLLPPVTQYKNTLLKTEVVSDADCYVISSVPTDPEIANDTGYSKKVSWIDQKTFLERKVVYYDNSDKLLKTQLTFDQRLIQPDKQRWLPLRREMVNNQTGHKTIYLFTQVALVPGIADQVFSTRNLEP